MKKDTIILLFVCSIVFAAALYLIPDTRATPFPTGQANDTVNLTLISATTSNKTGTAYFVEGVSLHTFQIVTLCTNAVSNVFQGSLDGSNWVPLSTNAVSASATNGTTLSAQRWSYIRALFTQTTASGSTNTVTYLGGRP